jgi:hypothetical protein
MARLDWEKARRRDVAPQQRQTDTGKGITNKQAKRLAALKRKLNEPYSGNGMTAMAAAREIRYAETRLGLKRGQPIPREAKRKRPESGVPADTWWWTPARFSATCMSCSELMPKGSTVAYNHHLRQALCELCADRKGLVPQLSAAAKALRRDAA